MGGLPRRIPVTRWIYCPARNAFHFGRFVVKFGNQYQSSGLTFFVCFVNNLALAGTNCCKMQAVKTAASRRGSSQLLWQTSLWPTIE